MLSYLADSATSVPITADQIVSEAREWIGVPFQWGAAVKEGCDCAGLILGVGWNLGLTNYKPPPYGRLFDGRSLFTGISRFAHRVDILVQPVTELPFWVKPADILLFRIGREPQHLALYAGEGRMIHADESIGRVVENGIDSGWARRLYAVYEWRGLS